MIYKNTMEKFLKISLGKYLNLMGYAIDLARISGMSDRNFNQFVLLIKKEAFSNIKELIELAKKDKLVSDSFEFEMEKNDKKDRISL